MSQTRPRSRTWNRKMVFSKRHPLTGMFVFPSLFWCTWPTGIFRLYQLEVAATKTSCRPIYQGWDVGFYLVFWCSIFVHVMFPPEVPEQNSKCLVVLEMYIAKLTGRLTEQSCWRPNEKLVETWRVVNVFVACFQLQYLLLYSFWIPSCICKHEYLLNIFVKL